LAPRNYRYHLEIDRSTQANLAAIGAKLGLSQPLERTGALFTPMNHRERIIRDPSICGGEPVFAGTRVPLRTVLASLAEGDSAQHILSDFPSLKPEDIQAAIAIAKG
jgi:uncharacterized protein (DUF433 family)